MLIHVQTTGLTRLSVAKNPQYTLGVLYGKILRTLRRMPEEASYRKYTEEIVSNRAKIVQEVLILFIYFILLYILVIYYLIFYTLAYYFCLICSHGVNIFQLDIIINIHYINRLTALYLLTSETPSYK